MRRVMHRHSMTNARDCRAVVMCDAMRHVVSGAAITRCSTCGCGPLTCTQTTSGSPVGGSSVSDWLANRCSGMKGSLRPASRVAITSGGASGRRSATARSCRAGAVDGSRAVTSRPVRRSDRVAHSSAAHLPARPPTARAVRRSTARRRPSVRIEEFVTVVLRHGERDGARSVVGDS